METIYEAAGGDAGCWRLAVAWHARVLADEVVSHAFSQGFHPDHIQRLATYWAEVSAVPSTIRVGTATKPPSSGCTAATVDMRTWAVEPSPVSPWRCQT